MVHFNIKTHDIFKESQSTTAEGTRHEKLICPSSHTNVGAILAEEDARNATPTPKIKASNLTHHGLGHRPCLSALEEHRLPNNSAANYLLANASLFRTALYTLFHSSANTLQ